MTENHITLYRNFLERIQNGKSLSDATQNYYLIALRSLLKYFKEKRISSLSVEKVILRKYYKKEVNEEYLNSEQIKKLLLAPDINTDKGLRDRVILEYILSTGLRINELVSLNVDFAHDLSVKEYSSFFSEDVLLWINKYLKVRKKYCSNSDRAFLIHLSSKTCGENRLTAESIERLINKYGREVSVDLKITPEVLRKSYFGMLFSKEIEINEIHCHRQLDVTKYPVSREELASKVVVSVCKKGQDMSWNNIENKVEKEAVWLRDNIAVLPARFRGNHTVINCGTCLFRKIASLIVGGQIKARELKFSDKNIWLKVTEWQGMASKNYE